MSIVHTLDDYISEDNPVRVIDAYVDSLDLAKLEFTKLDTGGPGAPSYNPADIRKLYIYGYRNQLRSSRKLERATYVNVEVIWLIKKLHPDFKTIADFRRENQKAIREVFKQFNLFCKECGSLDGSARSNKTRSDRGTVLLTHMCSHAALDFKASC